MMELEESVEECLRREVKEELNIELGSLQLFGVYSGKQLYTKLRNGHEYYQVIVGYLCTEYKGEIQPDGEEVAEACFYGLDELPETTQPFVKDKIKVLRPQLELLLRGT